MLKSEVRAMPEVLAIEVTSSKSVTGHLYAPPVGSQLGATLVLGHGAGADQNSGFMVSFAEALSARGLEVVTFNFLYTEEGKRAPDRNDQLEACYVAVIESLRKRAQLSGNKLFIGGKSMGGRIASQVAARGVAELAGLVFLGYPLHPPGRPDQLRAAHLPRAGLPMLFVQGSRDAFGTPEELTSVLKPLGDLASIYAISGGDHSFKVPKSAGVLQSEVYSKVQDEIVRWMRGLGALRVGESSWATD